MGSVAKEVQPTSPWTPIRSRYPFTHHVTASRRDGTGLPGYRGHHDESAHLITEYDSTNATCLCARIKGCSTLQRTLRSFELFVPFKFNEYFNSHTSLRQRFCAK
ncbi:hypothetical protein J6590_044241 [Homalodisca vitripennis]|nr:hypothetical protein J6590_044241 [Homalodisca vitripennis]